VLEITVEMLEERIAVIKQQKVELAANLNVMEGAIRGYQQLIDEMTHEENDTNGIDAHDRNKAPKADGQDGSETRRDTGNTDSKAKTQTDSKAKD
jgi:hypothetical protein